MARLRVVQVVLSLAPGGTERLVVELVRRTRGSCDSMVCCLDEAGAWAADLAREGTPVVALARRKGFRPSVGWRIAFFAKRHRANVLHCHHYTPFIYGGLAAALTRTGLVFTEHGRLSDAPPSMKRRLVNPVLGRVGGAIFAVSAHLRDHMVAEGLPAGRVSVIHNGIDPGSIGDATRRREARAVLGLPAEAFVVGTAARLDPVKDLSTLLSAFRLFREADTAGAHLVIFGEGPERDALVAEAATLGLGDRTRFTGHRADVRELLPALDLFVNCSISEGISLTILEAMATGLPIVATAVGGTPEVVIEQRSGLLVPARDAQALAHAITDLAASPERRRMFGIAGRERVLEHFTIDRMVSDYVAQYRRAARRIL